MEMVNKLDEISTFPREINAKYVSVANPVYFDLNFNFFLLEDDSSFVLFLIHSDSHILCLSHLGAVVLYNSHYSVWVLSHDQLGFLAL